MYSDGPSGQKVIKGQRKKSMISGPLFAKKRLAEHAIPKSFSNVFYDEDPSALLDHFPYLGEELCFANYKEKFSFIVKEIIDDTVEEIIET